MPEREPLGQKIATVANVAMGITVFGASLYGFYEATYNTVGWIRGNVNVPPRPEAPILPTNQDGTHSIDIDRNLQGLLRQSLTTYKDWQNFGQYRLQPLFNTRQPEEVWELLEQVSKNFITEGVNALQMAWILGYNRDLVQMDQSAQNLWVNGENFDLGSRYERQLAAAWIQTKVLMLDRSIDRDIIKLLKQLDSFTDEEISQQESEFGENLELLMWLKKRKAPIEMTEESFAFFPREELVATARVVRVVDQLGFDLPREAVWCSTTCLNWKDRKEKMMDEKGEIKEVDFSSDAFTFSDGKIELENTAGGGSLAHELGHLVSDQNKLLEEFRRLRGYSGQAPAVDRLSHISLYATWKAEEDFAETFKAYLMDGEGFRLLLQELRFHDPAAWEDLQRKYDFMKDKVFGGMEYSKDARTRAPYLEEREQEFAGLYWSAQTHSLEVRPNPNVWPGKRQLSKRYLVLKDGKIEIIQVAFFYDPKENSYSISIPNSQHSISEITFFPFPEDDGVRVKSGDSESWQAIEKGTVHTLRISQLADSAARYIQLDVASVPSVSVGS